ncbi:hypothetical protein ACFPM7_16670 [Actinokineospora guangxiensis]|uniref:Alpha amylase inhibitor n=1 Tax=Actinokineospora guangxiensis TaxID=1490288 RepID=A0ABW0EMN0_9PSEU
MRTILTAVTAVAVATGGLVAVPLAAAAEPVDGPPQCLHTRTWDTFFHAYVEVKNTCQDTQRFRIRWEGASDSQCITLVPGDWVQDSAVEPAWFSGLYHC